MTSRKLQLMKFAFCKIVGFLLAGAALCSKVFNVFAHIRPPKNVACEAIHAINSRMTFLKSVENTSSKMLKNDDAHSRENAVILHHKLVSTKTLQKDKRLPARKL